MGTDQNLQVALLPMTRRMYALADTYDLQMSRIFNTWQWDAILPCHGEYVPTSGKAVLQRHLKL